MEAATTPAPAITVHRWATRMRQNDSVHISNDYGDIRIKNSADSGLSYAGTVQKVGGEQRDPGFHTNKVAGGLALSVTAPDDWNGRVDAGVRVPPGAPLILRTGTGLIHVRADSNDIDAQSDAGDLQLRTGRKIVARTGTGSIRASLQNTDYTAIAASLATDSGDIEIWVRPDAALTISVSGGELTNNLPASIATASSSEAGTTIVALAAGGAPLNVTSVTGAISLHALPLPIPGEQR